MRCQMGATNVSTPETKAIQIGEQKENLTHRTLTPNDMSM